DPRFATNAVRLHNRAALRTEIEGALATWRREVICHELMRSGVPVGPVHTVPEAFAQAHAAHRGMQVEDGGYRGIGLPVRLSATPGRAGGVPPRYAQHTDEILQEAGLDAAGIQRLTEHGVLCTKDGP
ncbi:MAG: CoA transferase, partial [Comamonadaceae bacterium]